MEKNKFENIVVLPRESMAGNFNRINFFPYYFLEEVEDVAFRFNNLIKTNSLAVSFLLFVFILASIFTSLIL